jgi:hypothetical protein
MAEEMEREAERHLRQVTATLPDELSVPVVVLHPPREAGVDAASGG